MNLIKIPGSGPLVRSLLAIKAAEVCIMRTIEMREEDPEIAQRTLAISLENLESAKKLLVLDEPKT